MATRFRVEDRLNGAENFSPLAKRDSFFAEGV